MWCLQDNLNQMEDEIEAQQTRYATETTPMEIEPDSGDPDRGNDRDNAGLLEDQMERGCLLRDQRQASGGYACYSAMVSPRSDLSLPPTAKYSFEGQSEHKTSLPTHDDSHENLVVESLPAETGDKSPSLTVTVKRLDNVLDQINNKLDEALDRIQSSSDPEEVTEGPSVAHSLPAAAEPTEDFLNAMPVKSKRLGTCVQESEGSSIAHNLVERLEKRGYKMSSISNHASALPRGEAMLLLRNRVELPVLLSPLSDFNIKFAAQSLWDLESLLLSGSDLFIRMIHKDGMITVIYIHPVENQQVLIITELGMQSSPIPIEKLNLLFSAFMYHEGVTELAMFTHEAAPDDPAPSSEDATAGAILTPSLTDAIIEHIQQLGVSSAEHPPIEHTGAIRELKKTQDQAELALSMPDYGFQPNPAEGDALQNVEALTRAQSPFIAQLITPDQQVTVINFQPEASGDVMLSLSGQHFLIDRREIGALFDWIINQFKPLINIFLLAPIYI